MERDEILKLFYDLQERMNKAILGHDSEGAGIEKKIQKGQRQMFQMTPLVR